MEEVARVAHHPAHRAHVRGANVAERLGRDDVAADGDDPASRPRSGRVGVSVGGDEHVSRADVAAGGVHHRAVPVSIDGGDARALVDRRAGAECAAGQPGEVPRGMDARAVVGEHPSVEAAARRLLLERRGFQDHRRLAETAAPLDLLTAEVAHARAAMRKVQPAALRVGGIRRLRGRRPGDERVRLGAGVVERPPRGAVAALEGVEVTPHAAVDHAGVAPARSLTESAAVEDDDVLAVPCELRSRGEPGESRADDDHVSGSGKRRFRNRRKRRVVPPERGLTVALGKRRGARAGLTGRRPDAHNLLNSDKFERLDSVAAGRAESSRGVSP